MPKDVDKTKGTNKLVDLIKNGLSGLEMKLTICLRMKLELKSQIK